MSHGRPVKWTGTTTFGRRRSRSAVFADRLLERQDFRALREKVRTKRCDDGFHVAVRNVLMAVGNHSIALRLNSPIWSTPRKCLLLPELYSNPGGTALPSSPAA